MMREVVLDANVIVAWLDEADVLAARARGLMQRRTSPPDLAAAIATVREWRERGTIRWIAREQERLLVRVLDVVETTAGRLNFNDALLVVLQSEGVIGEVASFDSGFDAVSDFTRVA